MPTVIGRSGQQRFWIVTCPEPRIMGGVWRKWFREGYVAVGWAPPGHCEDKEHGYSLDSPSLHDGIWSQYREWLRQMRKGDKVVPFLLKRRIGPVGTITALHVEDSEWNPTVPAGVYDVGEGSDRRILRVPELGRRIAVEWESQGMPPEGQVAEVSGTLSRYTIRPLRREDYTKLVAILGNPLNWRSLNEH